MLDRLAFGDLPRKHHIALRDAGGKLRHEECLTREGFDGPYTIAYHERRPHTHHFAKAEHGWTVPTAEQSSGPSLEAGSLAKRHFLSQSLAPRGGAPIDARIPFVFNDDVVISAAVVPRMETKLL